MTAVINPDDFDGLVKARPEKVWGAPAIARVLGVSVATVYRLAANPTVPIYKPDGTGYFAFRAELERWLRTKP